ncbi:hypothetical protein Cpha266_2077 [Chlorobium phaeobacteroides DSM 266]|uniref:Uncharacterized protein n=1 Tax=Chlorobium phaeobacteroides (strain DSM 266 / SMG 266 / 2430) TaxID=290317 RepID=A1BI62_CHLPD|nr:hypothetical protein Cpha266_2077 [Chlorobium phaeobacteroides DSM 266]
MSGGRSPGHVVMRISIPSYRGQRHNPIAKRTKRGALCIDNENPHNIPCSQARAAPFSRCERFEQLAGGVAAGWGDRRRNNQTAGFLSRPKEKRATTRSARFRLEVVLQAEVLYLFFAIKER